MSEDSALREIYAELLWQEEQLLNDPEIRQLADEWAAKQERAGSKDPGFLRAKAQPPR